MKGLVCSIGLLCVFLCTAVAQNTGEYKQAPVLLRKTNASIKIDGQVTEEAWLGGAPAQDFWNYFPDDSTRAAVDTKIYMTFDDQHLYIGAICKSVGEDYVVTSLRRDYNARGNDNLTFLIDPFQDRTNAFVFGMNPYGVRREALISNGGQSGGDWDSGWDNKWRGESYIGDGYWSCEIAIPFSTIRFNPGSQEWNFNSYRFDTQSNTRSSWIRIPQNQIIMSLAFMGEMIWEEAPPSPKANISVIPFVSAAYTKDYEENEDANQDLATGADAKIAVTSGLNLDLTVNPDFSQVEVDEQVLNLDRFEVFFPERRQFFLENADLFGGFGDSRINPFFSRRIGIGTDTADNRIQIPINYGARLSGKLDNNWRVGLLNMQTQKDADNFIPAENYTVAAVQRKVFSRSNIGMIFVNKQSFNKDEEFDLESEYERVVGLDYNLASSDNRWNGKAFFHHELNGVETENSDLQKSAHGASLNYRVRDYAVSWEHRWVGEDYDPDFGFVPRQNFFDIRPQASLFFYPEKGRVNRHNIDARLSMLWKPEYGKTDHEYSLSWDLNFLNTSRLSMEVSNNYIYLLDSFDPSRTDSEELPADTDYTFNSVALSYSSDSRKVFSYRITPNYGGFFNGNRYGVRGSLTYRYQPFGQIEMNFNYTRLELPAPYASTSLFLIGPRIDLTFTKNLFLTTFLQYNSQDENMNINARLQWRYAPVSDFFLVYTDNYDTMDFGTKNRALVAKVTYWLNL